MSPFEVHTNLERQIAPKTQIGVKISIIGAALLIFFLPHFGLLYSRIVPQLCWILSIIGAILLACGVMVVIYLPAYYRRLSRLRRQTEAEQMRVTLRYEKGPEGKTVAYADLRAPEADEADPAALSVPVMDPVEVPPDTPAFVYGVSTPGPVVIETAYGILWPAPDERQRRWEQTFKGR